MNQGWAFYPAGRRGLARYILGLGLVAIALSLATAAPGKAQTLRQRGAHVWQKLRQQHFGNRPIADGRGVVRLEAPKRAEDPAVVPVTIHDLLANDPKRHIEKLWLVIDNNPEPWSAHFRFGPAAANATISTRVRVNTYTYMRVIAETANNKLYMSRRYVQASGGCSAPVSTDPAAAQAHIGEMRLRRLASNRQISDAHTATASPSTDHSVQLLIRHPNFTGLQMNQLTRLVQPAHFVDAITIHKGAALVLASHMTFSLSHNPSLRFAYRATPDNAGDLSVKVHDNKNRVFKQRWALSHDKGGAKPAHHTAAGKTKSADKKEAAS